MRFKSKWARFGSKGGKTKGPTKRRSPEHYKMLSALGVAARKSN